MIRGRGLLPPPVVLFSNNHLLVVNKPPGWSSIPTPEWPEKSLLSHLKSLKLGGGPKLDFLTPLHRLDQPCSGVLLLAKTSKAASRVTQVWKRELVEKTYLCALDQPMLDLTRQWIELEGWMSRDKTDRSVTILKSKPFKDTYRYVKISLRSGSSKRIIEVKTHMGARHMVRALLANSGHVIAGDIRYGARDPLQDQSVALHAHSVQLPMCLQLGTLEQRTFVAPLPKTWSTFFGTVS
jgi:23S rRNA pseudouridine1911/1915/1917 synthase